MTLATDFVSAILVSVVQFVVEAYRKSFSTVPGLSTAHWRMVWSATLSVRLVGRQDHQLLHSGAMKHLAQGSWQEILHRYVKTPLNHCVPWMLSQRFQCSRTCNFGMQTRNVTCFNASLAMDMDNNTFYEFVTEVGLDVCRSLSGQDEPPSMQRCNEEIRCPVRFNVGQYGQVSFL